MARVPRVVATALLAGGFAFLPTTPALADDGGSSIPDLGNCLPMIHAVFETDSQQVVEIPCVWSLKQSLQAVGYGTAISQQAPTTYTGVYDDATWQDVWRFQTAHANDGLVATGDADKATISLLDRIANSPAALGNGNGTDLNAPPAPAIPHYTVNSVAETGEEADDCATSCDREGGGEVDPAEPPAEVSGP
jgi:hypothetical protein